MRYLDLTLPSLAENLALDEALLLQAEAGRGGAVLRFWETPALAVVLGSSGRLHQEVWVEACRVDQVAIGRRDSGGGTVLLGPGCISFGLVLPYHATAELRDVVATARYVIGRVGGALAALGPRVGFEGSGDLAVAGRKVCGSAQRRKRGHLLLHASLLYDFPLHAISRYLPPPPGQPAYRGGRSHDQFLANLGVARPAIVDAIRRAWAADEPWDDWDRDAVAELARVKYSDWAWTARR